ncbi:MerR family transcriptional regulator [Streptomyces sp. R-74717]|uniref:MerR family DNA-binding transcriptional regulator n=1 Tax=Streptomyces TaxID=1883 RepID=UPI00379DEC53
MPLLGPARPLAVDRLAGAQRGADVRSPTRERGVSVRLLRCCEDHGLLTSHRDDGGHRQYAADALSTITRIRTLPAAAGLPTKVSRDLVQAGVTRPAHRP